MAGPASFDLTTHVYVRELAGGWLAHPLHDETLRSYGTGEVSLEELRLFLAEHLRRARPEVIAGFAARNGTRLVEVDVDLPRPDLPKGLGAIPPITMPCVVIPEGKYRWVMVMPLLHTVHLRPGEDLAKVVRDEARRVVTAREPSAFEYLQMLPAERHSLERLTVRVDRRDQVAVAADLARQERERQAHEVLVSVARPWHEDERAADRPPVVGRADDVARLAAMLSGKERRSVLLVGPELCGKTSVLRAWHDAERKARRLPRVYATSGVELLAGMSGFGQWQERVKRVMEAAEVLDAILYFDDLGDLFTDRTSSVVDMATQMKPYVEEDRVRVVAEVTPDVLSANDARHAGFLGAFLRVVVDPMSSSATASVLAARSAHRRRAQPDRLTLEDDALPVLLELVDRYEPYDAHPGKAVRLLDDVHASHADVVSYGARTLGAHEVHATFSLKTGIPLFLLRQDEPLHVGDVEQALRRRLVGQDRAVRRVAETVCVVKATLQPPGKPLAALLFTGPTGVGKTELARCLARYLFGSEERMLRFDMSEYQDPFAAQRLIRGTDRQDGLLTRRVRQQPFSVLLLDEIEKAHPAVFDLLLQVLGEGRLTDARGRTAFFHNAIVIMTSNLGGRRRRPVGLADAPASSESHDRRHVEELFRPELVNRIDRIVPFEALGASDVRTVAGMLVGDVALRRGFADLGIALEVSEAALGVLAQEGASPRYGARAMRRTIEDRVVAPLARLLAPLGSRALGATARVTIAGEAGGGDDAVASSVEENLRFEIAGAERSARREVKSIHDVAALRREVDGWMALPRCTEVKERLDVVVADLARLRKKKGKKEAEMPARERTALMTEHRRLEHVWSAARAAREEICSVEELALALALSGEDVASFAPDAIAAHRRFRRELLRLLTVMAPGCDSVTLMLVDVDGQEAFARWLALLLDEIAIRRFAVTLHVDGGERLARETWPPLSERRWGPPRAPDDVRPLLRGTRRCPPILVRCDGPFAGALLAPEAGLHRVQRPGKLPLHFLVHRMGPTVRITDDDWAADYLVPELPEAWQLRASPASRDHDPAKGLLHIAAKARSIPLPTMDEYWTNIDEIALEHLLYLEKDDDRSPEELWVGPLHSQDASGGPT